jgi:hypothetical protein
MARILGVALHPGQVIEVLFGSAPLLPEPAESAVSWEGRDGGREVLTLRSRRGITEVLYLQAAERTWDVREAEGRDDKGAVVWRLRHEGFSPLPLSENANSPMVRMPQVTYIEDPPHKSDVRLRWRERELNPELEAGVFELSAPPGIPVEPDVCAAPPSLPAAPPGEAATP